jgi:hypothetical protein
MENIRGQGNVPLAIHELDRILELEALEGNEISQDRRYR